MKPVDYEDFSSFDDMNDWLKAQNRQVINIETRGEESFRVWFYN